MEWSNQNKKHQVLHQCIVDACKNPQMFCKTSYMWSELIAENKPQCAHTDFDPQVVMDSDPKPLIGFTPMAKEGMILLVWTKIPVLADYNDQSKEKTEERIAKGGCQ